MATKTVSTKLGTEQVDPVVGFLGRTISDVVTIDKDGDKRIEGMEILQFAQKRGFDGFATFNGWNFKEFAAQIKDLDDEERAAQIAIFSKEFDIPNDTAEILVEDWLRYLDQGVFLVNRTRKLIKKEA